MVVTTSETSPSLVRDLEWDEGCRGDPAYRQAGFRSPDGGQRPPLHSDLVNAHHGVRPGITMLNKIIQCDALHNKQSSDMVHISLGARSFGVATLPTGRQAGARGDPRLV